MNIMGEALLKAGLVKEKDLKKVELEKASKESQQRQTAKALREDAKKLKAMEEVALAFGIISPEEMDQIKKTAADGALRLMAGDIRHGNKEGRQEGQVRSQDDARPSPAREEADRGTTSEGRPRPS